jgi:hypothetical protein
MERQAELPQIVLAPDEFGPRLAAFQHRQQQRRQNADDGDDRQQLHQREGASPAMGKWTFHGRLLFSKRRAVAIFEENEGIRFREGVNFTHCA